MSATAGLALLFAASMFADGVFRGLDPLATTRSKGSIELDALGLIGCIAAATYFLFRRPWQLFRQSKMVYAITSQRLLVISPSWPIEVRSYDAEDIDDVVWNVASNGSGYVVFKRVAVEWKEKRGAWYSRKVETKVGGKVEAGFYGISNPKRVARLVLSFKLRHEGGETV